MAPDQLRGLRRALRTEGTGQLPGPSPLVTSRPGSPCASKGSEDTALLFSWLEHLTTHPTRKPTLESTPGPPEPAATGQSGAAQRGAAVEAPQPGPRAPAGRTQSTDLWAGTGTQPRAPVVLNDGTLHKFPARSPQRTRIVPGDPQEDPLTRTRAKCSSGGRGGWEQAKARVLAVTPHNIKVTTCSMSPGSTTSPRSPPLQVASPRSRLLAWTSPFSPPLPSAVTNPVICSECSEPKREPHAAPPGDGCRVDRDTFPSKPTTCYLTLQRKPSEK